MGKWKEEGSDLSPSVPFPGARNYGGHLSLQKFNGEVPPHVRSLTRINEIKDDLPPALNHSQTDKSIAGFPNIDRVKYSKNLNEDGSSLNVLNSLNVTLPRHNGGLKHSAATLPVVSNTMKTPNGIHSSPPNSLCVPASVEVRDVYKSYGTRSKKIDVLTGINMTVPTGAIYGLLGPSGCGKTTLLRCIIGRLAVDGGNIRIFGSSPGTPGCGIPGSKVGYMPQEIALYNEFTIKETMQYFGRIHGMSAFNILSRMKFLLEFLHLPKETRFIKNLSGGQKRRVSFAVALLQEPPLMILDEPTVGVDPLLRQSIWNHLVTIAKGGNTTIIITTHYIEEARQAHVVGLMRGGRLLAESLPDNLLIQHSCPTLEEVFLKLCMEDTKFSPVKDEEEDDDAEAPRSPGDGTLVVATTHPSALEMKASKLNANSATNVSNLPFHTSTEVLVNEERQNLENRKQKKMKMESLKFFDLNKALAMCIKNLIRMWRNVGVMLFQFVLPAIQIVLFCLAIGRSPSGLDMAVVNDDNDTLDYGKMFLTKVDHSIVRQVPYTNFHLGYNSIERAEMWGMIYIPMNYSQNLVTRFYSCTDVEDEALEGSKIRVYVDATNQQIAYAIRVELIRSLQNFTRTMLEDNGLNPAIADIPMEFEEPVYGDKDVNFTEFMAPGIILSVSYFMAVGLTALGFVLERKEGLLDRTYVAGVNTSEIMIGHFFTQFFVMLVQTALSLLFMIVAFQIPCRGPAFWVVMLAIVQGMCGMAYGLVLSALCDEEHSVIMLALGSFYPNLLLSGIIWPLEGMPDYLRYLSYGLPQTYATDSMRALLSRGWSIDEMVVWRGFVITLAWLAVFIILAATLMRLRRQA